MQYCQVSPSGNISGPQWLPQSTPTVSNFNTLDDASLSEHGYYPYYPSPVPSYDPATQGIEQTFAFNGTYVSDTWTVFDLMAEEKAAYVLVRLTEIGREIGSFLDKQVSVKQYDSILSATSWTLSTISTYKAEGEAATAYRDTVWGMFYNMAQAVQTGTQPVPTVGEFFATLPPLWPVNNGTENLPVNNANITGNLPV
jgi:hypothetical protein